METQSKTAETRNSARHRACFSNKKSYKIAIVSWKTNLLRCPWKVTVSHFLTFSHKKEPIVSSRKKETGAISYDPCILSPFWLTPDVYRCRRKPSGLNHADIVLWLSHLCLEEKHSLPSTQISWSRNGHTALTLISALVQWFPDDFADMTVWSLFSRSWPMDLPTLDPSTCVTSTELTLAMFLTQLGWRSLMCKMQRYEIRHF